MGTPQRLIAYYRVSTKRQGQSGLGLEAQRSAVDDYLALSQGDLIRSFTEVESGRNKGRPELQKALEACRVHQAKLVIAKLDRLARNAAFLLSLRDAGVEFVCCDMPDANRLTVGILAMVAEDEAERISSRTRAALAAAKARGVKLGSAGPSNLKNQRAGSQAGNAAKHQKVRERVDSLAPIVRPLREQGLSLRAIADRLNEDNIPAARGGSWRAAQVKRLVDRLEATG